MKKFYAVKLSVVGRIVGLYGDGHDSAEAAKAAAPKQFGGTAALTQDEVINHERALYGAHFARRASERYGISLKGDEVAAFEKAALAGENMIDPFLWTVNPLWTS